MDNRPSTQGRGADVRYTSRVAATLLLVTVLTIGWMPQNNTMALTESDLQSILGGWPHYDPTESLPCGPTSACVCTIDTDITLIGADNAEKIWNFLRGQGLSPAQTAGVMGNLQAESGPNFDPHNVEDTANENGIPDGPEIPIDARGNDGTPFKGNYGYGIAQWTSAGRQEDLIEFARSKGGSTGDLAIQLEFLVYEAKKRGDWDKLLQTTTAAEAATSWHNNYEISADPTPTNRINLANDILARFGDNMAGTPAGSAGGGPTACSSYGQAAGDFVLPLDRSLYDANPNNFLKPHHDYPAADIPAAIGTDVYAVAGGKIISAPVGGNCGLGVEIDVGGGIIMTYCHGRDGGSVPGAAEGATVIAGQRIMQVGNTGQSTGPHLHLQIKVNGELRCPQPLLEGIANGSPPAIESLPSSGCVE
jgi:murein DD-endopeptidase MepM/ murein hydrolase activator NlpD